MRRLAPFPAGAVSVVAACKVVLGASVLGRYGWQRDELYYVVAARHLAPGYFDFPPVTALLGAGMRLIAGESRIGLRALALLAGAGFVVVTALIARELGGSRRAQTIAAVCAALMPVLLGVNTLFQPVSFDFLLEAVLLWLAVRLSFEGRRVYWILVGVVLGVGVETKYTMGVLAACLLVAAAIFRRDLLRLGDLAIALGIALLLAAPNIVWEAQHNWETVRFLTTNGQSATSETRPQFLVNLLTNANVALIPVWFVGFRRLHRDRATRWLAWGTGLVCLAYFVLGGKSYYAAPVFVLPLAAGSTWVDGWLVGARRIAITAVVVVALTLYALPIAVPVLPIATAVRWHVVKARSDYQDELGWDSVADGVAHAEAVLRRAGTPAAAALAANYGEAGALDVLGRGRGLPPTVSGNMNYRYWRPARIAAGPIVVVGYGPSMLGTLCSQWHVVARVHVPYGVDNQEAGQPIVTCTPRRPLYSSWKRLLDPSY
ncbi:MAG TPA: glycosyltransferase family 39 protein [Gaiellaceae bacterium]|nr:glycosyltransferase family 39 protein [Gaiellaceae bacterium]